MVFLKVDRVLGDLVKGVDALTLVIEVVLEPRHLGDEFISLEVVLEVAEISIYLTVISSLFVSIVLIDVLFFTLRKVTLIVEVCKAFLVSFVFKINGRNLVS
jgi:hypothetical protein